MVINDLPYEKRNLGVSACRFQVEQGDSPESIISAVNSSDAVYKEAIVDAGDIQSVHVLERCGFGFMESMVELAGNKKEIIIPSIGKRFVAVTDYKKATDEEINIILDGIEHSGLFNSDKIALNENFGTDIAGRRYRLWIEDLLKKDGICYSIFYNDVLYGFEILTVTDGIVDFKLGSALSRSGMSLALITATASYHYWMNSDIKKITTNVSSNNVNMIKIHELYGLKLNRMHYVLSSYKMC